ncbi:uncharacterized protein LOC131047727, partial [Cryptomeria japonica]|uniref:uncharacterized protein LOC131047727 n=1 Tax=Cryptomeria japonica TaxID=3369 RepID=UPI0027DAADBA
TRPTAKLILDDGALREYEHPVKVAQVLNEKGREAFFICLSDSINFNDCLAPLPAYHELQLDRLYFLLPLTKLKYPLLPSEMAAMVVKAAAALQSKQNKHRNSRKRRGAKVMPEMDGRQIQKSVSYQFNQFAILAVESKRTTSTGMKFDRKKHKQSWRTKLAPIPEAFAY